MAESSIPPRSEGDPLAWKQKALDDLLAAEKLFETLSEYPSLSWEVGFHSQQAVEQAQRKPRELAPAMDSAAPAGR